MLSGARARARQIRAAVMSLTASAPRLSRTSRWTAHRTSRAQTHRTLSSAPTPTVGAIGGTLRRPRVPPAPSAHLPAGVARGFQGWEGGRGKPIIVRAAPATDVPASDDAPPMARGKKPARGGTRADPAADAAAANPSVAAASGPPVDILADDALGPDHARVRRWVVFSDLHLNRRTSRVCVDVLEAVHREAVARDAGIAFLGDFWHARGAIPVEPLIDALDAIRSWTRPCVMIPGNHDQVTAGGEVHALTPLATANPSRVKIISKPTVWRNALWLPYRRDASVVKNAVEAAWSVDAEDGRPVRAVFCHADVIGASMNESFQARDGLDPSLLEGPAAAGATAGYRIPVYTGHYHKPHTVPNTNITYVGSPYQVSRAEAGQAKALVVLDAEEGWLGCERANPTAPADADPVTDPVTGVSPRARLPLDLGPRHYAVAGEDGDVPEGARAGDVIRWTLPLRSSTTKPDGTDKTGPDDETNPASKPPTQIERARAAGIAVEIAYETTTSPPRIPKAESLGPSGLYAAYAKAVDLPADVVELGKSVLEEVAANVAAADVDGTSARSIGGGGGKVSSPVQLSMRSVEVEGYGAFTDAVTYPLRDRGVCAVVGDNRDDGCSDSNGAGKTTLVMAAMWALTGNSDIRVEGGAGKTLTKTDVVNDYAKTARVRLEGAANGVPFWVERRVSRSKLLGLRYGVGDDERTLADSRLTQAAMDADLGASVAARIAFHGQHTVGQLLDANDAALKAALGELVDADTWQEAKDLSRKRVGEARKRAAALGADASARADYVRRIEQRLAAATAASEDWTAQVERNVSRLAREEEVAADALGAALGAVVVAADALRAASARWDAEEAEAAAEADAATAFLDPRVDEETDPRASSSFEVDEAAIASEAAALEEDAERARGYARELQGAEAAARAVAAQAHRAVGQYAGDSGARFEDVVGEEGASETHEHRSAGDAPVCATCLQPIDLTHRAHVLDRLKRDAETTRGEHQRLLASLRAAEAEAAATEKNAATPRPPRTGRGRTRPRAPRPPRTGRGTRRRGYERSATPGSTRTWSPRRWRGRRRWSRRAPWRPRVSRRMRILRPAGRRRGATPDIRPPRRDARTPATTRPPSPSSPRWRRPCPRLSGRFGPSRRDRGIARRRRRRRLQTRTIGKSPPSNRRRTSRRPSSRRGARRRRWRRRRSPRRNARTPRSARGVFRATSSRARSASSAPGWASTWTRSRGARSPWSFDPPPSVNPTAGRRDGDDADGRRGVREARTPRTRTGVTNAPPPPSPPPRRLKK